MRVAILTAQIGYYHDARYRALLDCGLEFSVLAVWNYADFSEFLSSSPEQYPVERLYAGAEEYQRACTERRVWDDVEAWLTKYDPDIVALPGWATPECFAAMAWARRSARRILMMSASQKEDAQRQTWREAMKARVVGLSDAALVGGTPHQEYISALGIPPQRVFKGYDAVDNSYFETGADRARETADKVRKEHGLPDRYLLASGRFIPKKNLIRLVEAYAIALQKTRGIQDLVIIGDGQERASIEDAIEAAGIMGRVHLPGFKTYEELPGYYGLSDGFVHVSTSEQWGLVINEAAASGVPLVASSACGATGEILVEGENGCVVDAKDTGSIADALIWLMSLSNSERDAAGRAARESARQWSPERFAKGFLAACDAALGQPDRGVMPWDAAILKYLARRQIRAVA